MKIINIPLQPKIRKKKEINNPEISLNLCLLKIIKSRNKEVFQKTS